MTNTTDIALLKQKLDTLEKEIEESRVEIEKLKALDEKRLRAAVVSLGTVVLGMGLYIWRVVVEGK